MPFSLSKPRPLVWPYVLVSFWCAALISLSSAWYLSRLIAAHLLERDATVSRAFVQTIVEDPDAREVLPGLPSSSPPLPLEAFFSQTNEELVNAIFGVLGQRLYRQPEIVRINVYAPDGMRIWSTNPRLVGRRNLRNTTLVRALSGQLAVGAQRTINDLSASEQARVTSNISTFSEMYLPIRDRSGDSIVGVVELYKASDASLQAIAQSRRWIWGGAIIGGILLYAVLLRLIPWSVRVIEQLREQGTITPPKSLFKLYAVLSLLFVAFLIVGPTWSLSAYMDRRMLERDATVTMQFAQTLLEDMDASAYLPSPPAAEREPSYTDFFVQTEPALIEAVFSDFSNRVPLEQLNIVRMSVYAPDGMRIWATQPEQKGIRWLGNSELVAALNGELAVERGIVIYDLTEAEKQRITSLNPVYSEIYMPIWDPSGDHVAGVIEVYKDSATLFQTIAQVQKWFWGVTIGLGLLLLGVLLGIMRRAVQVMEQQLSALLGSETLSVVGEMVAAIAQLLRQPLAAIRTSTKDIAKQGLHSIEPQVYDIEVEVQQLETWLRGLQAYALTNGHPAIAVELSTVLHDLIQQVSPSLDRQKVRLQVDVADALPAIRAAPALVHQVLHTVITNAQEAMPDGGTLNLRATRAASSPFIHIEISDTGHGMTPAQLEQVFQPLFTTKRRGLGIGLALAKRVVERQAGMIAIASTAGQGTQVTVSLPMAAKDDSRVKAQ
ncbi:sensor histidine kinase [Candidatus Entotheonella palauensis]|uniref:sensor histidine kinase n=1 Tax=Candidatus Entotheonella palauensis TaxID=93172 RepID=UPI002118DA03|nr:ATP-binding protein [Candidatus Entotheonella palauensis]